MKFDDAIGNWVRYMKAPEESDRNTLCGSAERAYVGSAERIKGGADPRPIYQTGQALKLERMVGGLPPEEALAWRAFYGFRSPSPAPAVQMAMAYTRARMRLSMQWGAER